MSRVLITGGCGDVGKYLVNELSDEYEITILDIDKAEKNKPCKYLRCSILDLPSLTKACKGIDSIVHLAGIRNYTGEDEQILHVNVNGTFNVLEAAKRNNIENVVISSSVCAMGAIFKFREFTPAYFPIDEEIPDLPDDMYGMSKLIDERLAYLYSSRYGVRIICLRLAAVLLPSLASVVDRVKNVDNPEYVIRLLDDGTPLTATRLFWQYVDPRDLPEAYRLALRALERKQVGFAVYNIGARDVLSTVPSLELIRRYYSDVACIKNRSRLLRDEFWPLFSISKARDELGYNPRFTWREFTS